MEFTDRRILQLAEINLGATQALADVQAIKLKKPGELSIRVKIDNGTDGQAPTDTPVGAWWLYCGDSSAGDDFTRYTSDDVDAELAKIAPNGNVLVDAWANFTSLPGIEAKLIFVFTGPGGASSRARARCYY